MLPAVPHLVVRDISLTLIVIASVLLMAMWFDAPLVSQANPGLSPNPTKAPWYFMGIQELLMHFHPVFALIIIPFLLSGALLLLPYLEQDTDTSGIWFRSHNGRKMSLITFIFSATLAVSAVLLDEFVFISMSGPANMVRNGLLPFFILTVIGMAFSLLMKRVFAANTGEIIQMVFTMIVTVFISLTVIGVWFRGPGLQLMWTGG